MLPLPPIRITPKRARRSWVQRLNSYTLWAFNPQPPLVDRSSAAGPADSETTR